MDNVWNLPLHPGSSFSCWQQKGPFDLPNPLQRDEKADVCIIGAGIAGMSCAYYLALEGKSVVILEKEFPGAGQTGLTTGHLSFALDDRFFDIEKVFGLEGSQLAAKSHRWAVQEIGRISMHEVFDCEYKKCDGYLFAGQEEDLYIIQKEFEACHRAGLLDVAMTNDSPFPHFATGPCLKFPEQAQFHSVKYLNGLASAIKKRGGKIFTKTKAIEFSHHSHFQIVTENGYRVQSEELIVATNTPINNRLIMHTKQAAYRTYVLGARIPKGSLPSHLIWDTLDPYHYVRLWEQENEDILIVGGEDHKTGQKHHPETIYALLEEWIKMRVPVIKDISYHWSGQIMEPVDYLGFFGKNPHEDHVSIVTGDSGNGLTHGTIAGKVICDLILKRENPWRKLYDPARKTIRQAYEFAHENLNALAQYREWFTVSDSKTSLLPETACVLQKGMKKVGVYRDSQNQEWEVSLTCPHLGAILRWNDAEKTWDCPAHGSRFDCQGTMINGPACSNLKIKTKKRD
jgi:glycine/D-amino acid oxidase-like deaminating enzyme/nitrite reductase/ring-hydroxylating ferredoxin subunit